MNCENMKNKFPAFPLLEVEVIALFEQFGFVFDTSWQHDICPSFSTKDDAWTIMVDHPDTNHREFDSNKRFSIYELEDGQIISDEPAFSVETFQELKQALLIWQSKNSRE